MSGGGRQEPLEKQTHAVYGIMALTGTGTGTDLVHGIDTRTQTHDDAA